MDNISYLFDIDGTLTEPRQPIKKEFEQFFFDWMQHKKVYFVTGSDLEKVKEQLTQRIIDSAAGIFCSMANEYYVNGSLVYSNQLDLPFELLETLKVFLYQTKYSPIRSTNFEYRKGMLNFSIAGRDSSNEEREKYYQYDLKHKERKEIADLINDKFGDQFEARIGGRISIDIQPKGKNKSQASKWIRKHIGGKIYFFGDKTGPDGNDYDIVQDILENKDGIIAAVDGPNNTKRILMDL
jgi:phosphomannomutase